MKNHRLVSILTAVAMGVVIIAPIQLPGASAAVRARSNNALTLNSGTLLVFAAASQTFLNPQAPASIAITGNTYKNFWINNSGTEDVSQFTITVTLPANANVNVFRRCDLNVSFTGPNTCASGTVSTFALTPGTAKTFVSTLPSMGFYSFQIIENKSGTMGVSTSVFSNHIVGSTTNS